MAEAVCGRADVCITCPLPHCVLDVKRSTSPNGKHKVDQMTRVGEMYDSGFKQEEIIQQLGISASTVLRYWRKYQEIPHL